MEKTCEVSGRPECFVHNPDVTLEEQLTWVSSDDILAPKCECDDGR